MEPEGVDVKGKDGLAAIAGTTMFIDDATVAVRDESMIAHIDNTLLDLNDTQATTQSIIDFLSKPLLIFQGNFSTVDTLAIFNYTGSMPYSAFITPTDSTLWRNKFLGYFGIRMDMRFRLVLNATRMQQGRYCMGFIPYCSPGTTAASLKDNKIRDMHTATLVQRTTIPHVEIDVGTGTACELLVPFTSVHNYYPLNAVIAGIEGPPLGSLRIYPYVPMTVSTGPTIASYSVYCSLENIKLFGAASPQSGISDQEVSQKQAGPISGVARSFARGFNEFSDVPLISGYAKSVSWIADRIANTASKFGYSKPTAGDNIVRMQIQNAPANTTVDGDSDARPLSYLSKPGIVQLDGLSGKKFDEMDFSYICRKYAYFDKRDWTVGTSPSSLVSYFLNPQTSIMTTAGSIQHFSPVAFVGNFFTYWRGSLKIKVKFVKTEFHSGRLAFSFYPGDEVAFYFGFPAYVNRMIVDIRETTEVELIFPFIARQPWLKANTSYGKLGVEIIDPLVAPANVPQTVQLLFEMAGGDDIEFAVPAQINMNPTVFTPQSGCEDDKCILKATVGNSRVTSNPNIFSSTTIGDKVSNFRAYLKRYHPLRSNDNSSTSAVAWNTSGIYIIPDVMPVLGTIGVNNYLVTDLWAVIGSCYGMIGGGVRFRDIIDTGLIDSAKQNSLRATTVSYLEIISSAGPGGAWTRVPAGFQFSSVDPNTHVNNQQLFTNNVITMEVPQYTPTFARSKNDLFLFQGDTSATGGYITGASGTAAALQIMLPADCTFTARDGYPLHSLYRAMADDGNFSTFISVPPMKTTTQVNNLRGYF